MNEHPVTIYPGRSSPSRKNSNRKSAASSHEFGEDSSECDEDDEDIEDQSKLITIADTSDLYRKNKTNILLGENVIIKSSSSYSNRRSLITSDDEFSDDSLENGAQRPQHVPTKIPTPVIPSVTQIKSPSSPKMITKDILPAPQLDDMPFSHSPTKCSPGIAWEINLNDEPINLPKCIKPTASFPLNFNDGENSVASTPCNSIMSTDHSLSSDWPDPPEQPICSTEDEAGSIFTDSGEFICLF